MMVMITAITPSLNASKRPLPMPYPRFLRKQCFAWSSAMPFPQDGLPAEPGVRAFEQQELEEHALVVHRHAPFLVVIGDAEWRGRPCAALSVCHRAAP